MEDRDLLSDIDTFTREADGALLPMRDGTYAYLPEATQSMPGLSSFRASLGQAWHANTPRRGAVATRAPLPHAEIQGCVACDPTVFTMRAYDTAMANGYADVNPHARQSLLAQLLISLGLNDRDSQVRIAANELVYNYEELKPMRPSSAKPKPGEPSYETFKQRVQPILTRVNGDGRACVLCHSTQGKFPLHMPGKAGFTEAQSQFNYQSVLREINREEPKRSLLLIKPTRPNDNAGDPALHTSTHGGGTRWGKNTAEASSGVEYETILNWIRSGSQ